MAWKTKWLFWIILTGFVGGAGFALTSMYYEEPGAASSFSIHGWLWLWIGLLIVSSGMNTWRACKALFQKQFVTLLIHLLWMAPVIAGGVLGGLVGILLFGASAAK
jgi:hypothetical protein